MGEISREDALSEGIEILVSLSENIQRHGNYTAESTVTFIDNALQCLRLAAKDEAEPVAWRPIGACPHNEAILVRGGGLMYPVVANWSGRRDESWWLDGEGDVHVELDHVPTEFISLKTLDPLSLFATPPTAAQDEARERVIEECYKLDTDRHVFFYEQDFYVLSNFSAFNVLWRGVRFQTAEHAYHFERFWRASPQVTAQIARDFICNTTSAHEAFRYAQDNKGWQRKDWDAVKVDAMREILRVKAAQHEYVRRKLLATGDRELVEDSWRDDFWGWGPNRDGQNMLGKLWMEARAELRALSPTDTTRQGGEG